MTFTDGGRSTAGVVNPASSTQGFITNGNLTIGALPTIIVPGNYNDFVTVDNINLAAVSEPSTLVASALGVWLRRRRTAA